MSFFLRPPFAVYSTSTGVIRIIVDSPAHRAWRQPLDGEAVVPVGPEVKTNTHTIDTASLMAVAIPAAENTEHQISEARAHRDRLLAASDWTQVPDNRLSPEQRAAWASVREEWRSVVDDLKAGREARAWADEPSFT